MDTDKIYSNLKSNFPNTEIYQNHPLAPYTTINIGGPADIFIHTYSSKELTKVLKFIYDLSPATYPTILGNGSNVLISDSGIRGIVIKNSSTDFEILNIPKDSHKTDKISTHRTENDPRKYLNFGALDYDESDKPPILVRIDSGCQLPPIINQLIDKGITGLQWFGYIPGTIGGAVYSNIHGGAYHFSDFIQSVEVFDTKSSTIYPLPSTQLTWGYDSSSFQLKPHLIITSITLSLFKGDPIKAKKTVDTWIKQKSAVQSMNSLGSVFKNLPLEICQKIWGEQKSTGWIIDNELKLKGFSIGDAQISPLHANFIVNNGQATADDYFKLVKFIQTQAKAKLNLNLEPEIKFLGEF